MPLPPHGVDPPTRQPAAIPGRATQTPAMNIPQIQSNGINITEKNGKFGCFFTVTLPPVYKTQFSE